METINPQSFAIRIEGIVRRVFNCEQCGENGIADADYIRKKPLLAMLYTLSYVCMQEPDKKEDMEYFFDAYCSCGKQSLDELLKADYDIVTEMIDAFSHICK